MKAQNAYTHAVLASIPGRDKLFARIQQFDRPYFQRNFATRLPGGSYLTFKIGPNGGPPSYYIRHGRHGEDRLLIDPARVKLAARTQGKGANSVAFAVVSQDGRYVYAGIMPGGSAPDMEIHVFDTATGRETGDVIPRAWQMGYEFRGIFADKLWAER